MIIFLILSAVMFFSFEAVFDHHVKNSTSSKEDSQTPPPQKALSNRLLKTNGKMSKHKAIKTIQVNNLFWGVEIDIPIG